ncbi:unnamed protein product [Timema podura]|uniref:Ubiquinone biosynthesis protein n=1 Tax=Timema podura TaxID=61482 RepID=A0ABN7P5X5_TIMPD|nr:unnamed protein product [Timema podura]
MLISLIFCAQFNWYSRRIALAGIYKMTELCLIQDKSEDYQNTWSFLDRRIKDVTHLHGYLHQSEEFSQVAKEAVTATFVTARNILGLSLGSRVHQSPSSAEKSKTQTLYVLLSSAEEGD